MPAPAAPPPAAPSAPAAPAAAPAKPAPSIGADRQDSTDAGWLQEAGNELEALDRETNQPRPPRPAQGTDRKPKPPAAPAAPKEDDQATPTAIDDDIINPGDEPPPPAKPAVDPNAAPERPMKAPELRKAYEDSKRRITEELEPEVTRLRSRVQELEQSGPKDTEQTTQKLKSLEERNKTLEDFVRLKHYEQSEEFQQKYKAHYEKAWEKCLRDISQLEVEVSDGKGGYVTRKASDADITYLAGLPLGDLIKQSNAMFGDAGDIIRGHVQEINRTWEAQQTALDEAQKRSIELSNNAQKQQVEQAGVREKLWSENNNFLATKYPTFFAPVQGDVSGNKLLHAGFAFTDLLFSHQLKPEQIALLPERYRQEIQTKGKLSQELTVRAHAIIRNKAANHDRLARTLKAERTAHEETKKKLAAYEDSEPSAGASSPNRGPATNGHWQDDYNREIDELDRQGR